MNLTPGGNAPVPTQPLIVRVLSGAAVDVSAFRLYASGKVQDGGVDMVFYGQPCTNDGTVVLAGEGVNTSFSVNISAIHQDVQKIAFTATVDSGKTIANLGNLKIQVEQGSTVLMSGEVPMTGRNEAALIVGELYRRNNEWKFRFISQGFNGGLKPLAEHFGVEVDDEPTPTPKPAPAPTPKPAPATPPVSLQKVTLSKANPTVSLTKQGDSFGQIRVNLNWQRGTSKPGFMKGLFQSGKGIDLDLGAFVETADGKRGVVQALGDSFGRYDRAPFVELQDDDRTGASVEGEWLFINGAQWQNIKEILIYAFIYEGVPSWENTDGVVTIDMPGQPPIETHLTDGNSSRSMCAIARLINDRGTIKVERINRYFGGHKELDDAFGWGFRWSAGSK